MDRAALREKLAELEHVQWARITAYLIEHATDENLARWRRQIATPYSELSEAEKDKDREWADRVLAIVFDSREVHYGWGS